MVMGSTRRRKCLNCQVLFKPDPRNCRHQRYCSNPVCRRVSKAASQARWLAKPGNSSYFCSSVHVARVQAWRARHPGYWKYPLLSRPPLQDVSATQPIELKEENDNFASNALQDVLQAQPAVLIGLIAHIIDSPLQDDIAKTSQRLLQLGQDILVNSLQWNHGPSARGP